MNFFVYEDGVDDICFSREKRPPTTITERERQGKEKREGEKRAAAAAGCTVRSGLPCTAEQGEEEATTVELLG